MTFEEAAAYALTLPETERATSYGQPAVKLAGKMLIGTGHERATAFVLSLPLDAIDLLLDLHTDAFFQTPHYQDYPAVLVRYTAPAELTRYWIRQAWRHRAPARLRKAGLDEPPPPTHEAP